MRKPTTYCTAFWGEGEKGSPTVTSYVGLGQVKKSCEKAHRRCFGSVGAAAMSLRAACSGILNKKITLHRFCFHTPSGQIAALLIWNLEEPEARDFLDFSALALQIYNSFQIGVLHFDVMKPCALEN